MASVPRSQPTELSQRGTTAPMNDMPVTVVKVTNEGGISSAAGDIKLTRHDEDKS